MKRKAAIYAIVLVFGLIVLGSCKTHKPCPAYGSVDTETVDEQS